MCDLVKIEDKSAVFRSNYTGKEGGLFQIDTIQATFSPGVLVLGSGVQSPLGVNFLLKFILLFAVKQYKNANIANFV